MEKKMYITPSMKILYFKSKWSLLAGSELRSIKRTEEDANEYYEVL